MGYQIIQEKEKDRYAIFSSMSDTFVLRWGSETEVERFFIDLAKERTVREVKEMFDVLLGRIKRNNPFKLSIEEAIELEKKNKR